MADKRLLALILTLIMAFSFSACRRTPTPQEEDPSSVPTATPAPEVDILATATPVPDSVAPITSDEETSGDLVFKDILSGVKSDFNSAASVSDTGWSRYHSGNVSLSPDGVDGTQCIKYSNAARDNNRYSYSCPAVNLYNYLKKAGTYKISFAVRLGGEDVDMVVGTGFKIIIRGNGVEMLIKRALGEEHADMLPETLEIFKKDYSLHSEDNTKPYPGITELLKKLNANGVKCAIVSNKFDGAVKKLSEKYFGNLILCAVGESENVRKKPAPDSVFKVMDNLGLDKSSCVYVGDSDVDILTAKNAGIPCISVTWGFRKREFLVKNGAAVFAGSAEQLWDRLK